ncbi:MAG: TlpA disulfide reductase family protein [Bacteroidota bacterium]
MRKTLLLLGWLLMGSLAMAVRTDHVNAGAKITFNVQGLPDGYCRIIGMIGNQNYLLDSIKASGGTATLIRNEPLDGGLYYFVFPDQVTFIQFLVDKEQEFTMKTNKASLIERMQVSGSTDNKLFYESLRFEQEFQQRYDSVTKAMEKIPGSSPSKPYLNILKDKLLNSRKDQVQKYAKEYPNSFFTFFKVAGQNPELQRPQRPGGGLDTLKQLYLYRQSYWKNTPLDDERLLRTPVIYNKLNTFIKKLTPQVPDSIIKYADYVIDRSLKCKECFKFITNWIAIEYEKPKILGGDAILVHIVDKYFTDELAFWYAETPKELNKIRRKVNEMRPSLIGNTGQDLACRNVNGQIENLYSLKTPYKILFMYSYSCHHCQERAPVLREVFDQMKGIIDVYALCLDPEEDRWREFINKYNIQPFHNVIDPNMDSRYYRKYHVDVTPELYILDQNNRIIAKDLHPNQVADIIAKNK